VQVENIAGAAGTIGLARFVSAERGNPHALMITGLVMVAGITTNRAAVGLHQTTPIARLTGEYEVIVVPAASPHRTLTDLLSAFAASPASVTWGGGSAGGTDDLLVRLMAEAMGVASSRVNYIAFAGGGAALAGLLGGQLTAGVSGYGEFAGQIEGGTLRALAISAPARVDRIDTPTLREQGVGLDLANWRGIVAPPGLTDAERDALTARVERLAASDGWQTALARNGWQDMLLTGAAFRQFLNAEQARVDGVLARLDADASVQGTRQWRMLTPMTAPTLALIGLSLLSGCLLAQRVRRRRSFVASGFSSIRNPPPHQSAESSVKAEGGDDLKSSTSSPRWTKGAQSLPAPRPPRESRALLLTTVLGVHALVFPLIGFVPASTALFAITTALFGSRRPVRDMAIGLAAAMVLYVTFTAGLGLTLPVDPVTRWLRR